MLETLISFFQNHQTKFLTFHILGVVLGLGGATISDILFFKFLKDYRISKKEEEVLHLLKNFMLSALGIIIVTGFALYWPAASYYNGSAPFLVKAIGVGVITLNGIALHVYVAPHLIHLNLKNHQKMGRNWHRLAFALGAVSVVSWYSVFFIAMLKSNLTWSFGILLSAYLVLLGVGVLGSQWVEVYLSKKANKKPKTSS